MIKEKKGKKRRVERKAEKWRRTHIILAFYRDVSLTIPSSSLTFSFAEFLGISVAHAFWETESRSFLSRCFDNRARRTEIFFFLRICLFLFSKF